MTNESRVVLLLLATLCCLQIIGQLFEPISAAGVAETLLRAENRELSLESDKNEAADKIFEDKSNTIGPLKGQLNGILEKLHIELVAPNKELAKMMATMSTMTRSMFLKDHKKYSEELKVHTTSRPMLLSYLGLHLATNQQVADWYARYRVRLHRKVVSGCESFIGLRQEAEKVLSAGSYSEILKKIVAMDNRLPLVKLKFDTNVNLFMIDNYLKLCSKLELPTELRDRINKLQVPI